jgi:hypothetical protein
MAKTPCLRDQRLGLTQRLDLPAHGHERRAVDTLLPPLGVPGHHVGDRRLMGGSPPSAVWRR